MNSMSSELGHPTAMTLSWLKSGLLIDDARIDLLAHLSSCPACMAAYTAVEPAMSRIRATTRALVRQAAGETDHHSTSSAPFVIELPECGARVNLLDGEISLDPEPGSVLAQAFGRALASEQAASGRPHTGPQAAGPMGVAGFELALATARSRLYPEDGLWALDRFEATRKLVVGLGLDVPEVPSLATTLASARDAFRSIPPSIIELGDFDLQFSASIEMERIADAVRQFEVARSVIEYRLSQQPEMATIPARGRLAAEDAHWYRVGTDLEMLGMLEGRFARFLPDDPPRLVLTVNQDASDAYRLARAAWDNPRGTRQETSSSQASHDLEAAYCQLDVRCGMFDLPNWRRVHEASDTDAEGLLARFSAATHAPMLPAMWAVVTDSDSGAVQTIRQFRVEVPEPRSDRILLIADLGPDQPDGFRSWPQRHDVRITSRSSATTEDVDMLDLLVGSMLDDGPAGFAAERLRGRSDGPTDACPKIADVWSLGRRLWAESLRQLVQERETLAISMASLQADKAIRCFVLGLAQIAPFVRLVMP